MVLRTPQRESVYQSDWGFASVVSALLARGVRPERVVRALDLLERRHVPAERLGSALVLVFGLSERTRRRRGQEGRPSGSESRPSAPGVVRGSRA